MWSGSESLVQIDILQIYESNICEHEFILRNFAYIFCPNLPILTVPLGSLHSLHSPPCTHIHMNVLTACRTGNSLSHIPNKGSRYACPSSIDAATQFDFRHSVLRMCRVLCMYNYMAGRHGREPRVFEHFTYWQFYASTRRKYATTWR